jgi:uncharacterized protein (TIGR04255 family)
MSRLRIGQHGSILWRSGLVVKDDGMADLTTLPSRLERDAIVEVVCEFRFDCPDGDAVPERVIGRLADRAEWRSFEAIRLLPAELVSHLKSINPELGSQPVMELRNFNLGRAVKIGSNVLSFHALKPYPGWQESLSAEIAAVVDFLFAQLRQISMSRIGLRYLNVLNATEHGVAEIGDLNYSFKIDGQDVAHPQLVSFQERHKEGHVVTVRVASPEFVTGRLPAEFSAFVDIDVSATAGQAAMETSGEVKDWIEVAHGVHKAQFFKLLSPQTVAWMRPV